MDMITYAKAKKYTDKAVATGGNAELIETLISEEVTKVVAGADSDFDTLKEVADWIKDDKVGAAKMQTDIETLKTDIKLDIITAEDIMEFFADNDVAVPLSSSNNTIYTNSAGEVYVL